MTFDKHIEKRVNEMAENLATLTGFEKEEQIVADTETIKMLCENMESEPAPYLQHYFAIHFNEVCERAIEDDMKGGYKK